MVKLTVGSSHGSSKTTLQLNLPSGSVTEISVGNAYDMSVREIFLIERDAVILDAEIAMLQSLSANFLKERAPETQAKAIVKMADDIASSAKNIVTQRKWFNVSASGLLEAARAVGEVASPLVSSALKIIDLLHKIKSESNA